VTALIGAAPVLITVPVSSRRFKSGSLMIARLAPQDYHRWHVPVDGVFGILSAR